MSSSRVCTQCGCTDIDIDSARGDAVCTGCGWVLEDQIIVSEIQFQDNACGGASVIGQYVSAEGVKSMSMGSGFHHGLGKESRAITLQNGKRRIQALGDQLRLNQHCIDTAYNFFKMGVTRRLTRGRKTSHVVAACLYLVCRTEGTPHMLLDFADVLQVNVYNLGRTYLQLSRELCINIPALDPCLYIHRFAHKLEFSEKTHEVSMTALRLVSRMKRDWMSQGRRPSGLCGAALLVASRIHNFNRTIKEIIKVVKIGEGTIRKRLAEFEQTPSSQLTIDEFQKIDLEEEMDPPSFTEGRIKAKKAQAITLELDENGLPALTSEISELQMEIEKALEEAHCRKGRHKIKDSDSASICSSTTPSEDESDSINLSQCNQFITQETLETVLSSKHETDSEQYRIDSKSSLLSNTLTFSQDSSGETYDEFDEGDKDPDVAKLEEAEIDNLLMPAPNSNYGPRPTAASLGLTESIEECMKVSEVLEPVKESGELEVEDLDEEELDAYLLSNEEIIVKTKIWTDANADYLVELKEKERREAELKEQGLLKPDKKKRKAKRKAGNKEATSAGEAIEKMLQERKISSKINYEVLRNLNQKKEQKPEVDTSGPVLGEGPIQVTQVRVSDKRFRKPTMTLEHKAIKKGNKEPLEKKPRLDDTHVEVVVESGPVHYIQDDEEEEEDCEEEDEHISAAKLLGHGPSEEDYGEVYEVEDD